MKKEEIKFTFLGMDSSDALKEYALSKISKREDLIEKLLNLEVAFKEHKASRGVKNDFRVDISVDLPETPIRVTERGEDMYANIDLAVDTLVRRLTRYFEMRERWGGSKEWEVMDVEGKEEESFDEYTNYVPKIAKRKKIKDMSPLEEGEAIERMEMLGYDSFLFRSKKTDKISLVYKRKDGSYGIVEPS
ncbi:MAG TPA: ribosome-associated translation inhibitor RaiA [Candidatus Dojkabacteria bacterium]|nr:ribosome-associated translation inhibitor RaiA [Candidatus Dojkabacteria bacterium]